MSLSRHTPLRPGGPIKYRRKRRLDRETEAEKAHKATVRLMGVCAAMGLCPAVECMPPLECAHLGHGGMGQKRGDWTDTAMLCRGHHRAWDEHRGQFARWSRDRREEQAQKWIREARAFVETALALEDSPF